MSIARDLASGSGIEAGEVLPHIIPGVLYPAVAGKDLSGTALGGSYTYGTAHTDGRSYYYTDIKGSKPIKDPRIGAHFGSQRHRFTSHQQLEQETATHGKNVYSIDGREWCRMVGPGWTYKYTHYGNHFASNANNEDFIEFTGYFSQVNWISTIWNNSSTSLNVIVDGTSASTSFSPKASVNTPLGTRYVDSGSVLELPVGTLTLGIHTVKVGLSSTYWYSNGFELIAQDTSSTANKSKIQIPSQNVVSYGKKFTVSGTPHYDPFNGFVDDTTLFSAKVDTATSLGLGTATTWGAAWDTGSDDHIRPFNGGRVVKWVDSDGTIKTSVTMMPRNAQNVGTTASNEITDVSSTNSHTINFSDDAIDNSLSEVAKTFIWREFGNGAANGGTGSGSYPDASMLASANDDIGYVMDDGLTSLAGNGVRISGVDLMPNTDGSGHYYITFIGTGIRAKKLYAAKDVTIAQNLPYGTHILKIQRSSTSGSDEYTLDGVALGTFAYGTYGSLYEISFYQPKKPPIPEDAVVLADYMLMADFVKTGVGGYDAMSKGVRKISLTRDVFADSSSALGANVEINTYFSYFMRAFTSGSAKVTTKLPAFASEVTWQGEMGTASIDSSENSWGGNAITMAQASGGTASTEVITYSSGTKPELGMNVFQHLTQSGGYRTNAMEIATPIHTSSHYQTFETPFLHEVVGGDRNMEQTNLVVSPDGKTWDEVTRDTSYIGNVLVTTNWASQNNTNTTVGVGDEFRGREDSKNLFVKDFAIAYDRLICLVDGHYQIIMGNHQNSDSGAHYSQIRINGTPIRQVYFEGTGSNFIHAQLSFPLKRGDYIDHKGMHFTDETFQFQINRLS